MFKGKTLLITGGTGSFGNAVLRRFISTDIGEIRIFSRDEKKQDDMRHEFQAKYPDFAEKVVSKLLAKEADLGILVCGTGIGISIAANRHKGIRAAILYDDYVAKVAREHNNANVLCFGGRTMTTEDALRRIGIFLKAEYEGGRHDRRLCKLDLD